MKSSALVRNTFSMVLAAGMVGGFASTSFAAFTPVFSAKIYDLKDKSKLMFNYKNEVEVTDGKKVALTTITDLEGKVVVVETTTFKVENGVDKLVSFEQDQKQLGAVGKLEVVDGKVKFTYTKDGSTKTADEKAENNLVVTATVVAYLQQNWQTIASGGTVKTRLGVVDRRETVGFNYFKESERDVNGAKAWVVKMKPTSVIISAIVDPLRFTFTPDGKRLIGLEGRTAPKVMKDGKYKDFDGYTVYEYAEEKPKTAEAPVTPATAPQSKPAKKK